MNLAQMRKLTEVADDAIDNFAAGVRSRLVESVVARDNLVIKELGVMNPMPWTAFEFQFQTDVHTVVLDKAGAVVGHERAKRSR